MPADIDRHPRLGRRRTLASEEECLEGVRAVWPGACAHGSTGIERSWTIEEEGRLRLVAHHWSPGSRMTRFHLRVAVPTAEAVWWD